MSEEADQDQKTDFVSQRRLEEAWREGRVPLGREAPQVAGAAVAVGSLLAVGPALHAGLVELTRAALVGEDLGRLPSLIAGPAGHLALVLGAGAAASAAATLAQTRGHLWPQLALPDFERLWHAPLGRTLSKEGAANAALTAAKLGAIAAVSWAVLRDDVLTLQRLFGVTPEAQLFATLAPLRALAVRGLAVLALFAGVELALTHLRFVQKLKMTRDEAKREVKEDEGDPLLRSRRKRRAKELARGRASAEVPRADAVVVNPTHVAVALRYRKDEGAAPRVVAKGKGQAAEHIRELARLHGVPIVEDIALARLLYRRVKVGGSIPQETFRAVAAVLAFVYRVTGRRPGEPRAAELGGRAS